MKVWKEGLTLYLITVSKYLFLGSLFLTHKVYEKFQEIASRSKDVKACIQKAGLLEYSPPKMIAWYEEEGDKNLVKGFEKVPENFKAPNGEPLGTFLLKLNIRKSNGLL